MSAPIQLIYMNKNPAIYAMCCVAFEVVNCPNAEK